MFERIKARAACAEFGWDPEVGATMLQIHGITHGGKKPEVLDSLRSNEKLMKLADELSKSRKRWLAENGEIVLRLALEPNFRAAMLEIYQERVLPRVKTMTFLEMLKAIPKEPARRY